MPNNSAQGVARLARQISHRLRRPLALADRRSDRQPGSAGRFDAANRSAAADRAGASPQLSRSGHSAGRIGAAPRSAPRDRRTGRAAGRRHFRHGAHARRAGGQAAAAQPAFAAFGRAAAQAGPAGGDARRPITSASKCPTCSSSAMGSTIRTPIATCPTWPNWTKTTCAIDGGWQRLLGPSTGC